MDHMGVVVMPCRDLKGVDEGAETMDTLLRSLSIGPVLGNGPQMTLRK